MDVRGPAVLVVLLALGVGGGFAVSAQARDSTIGTGVAAPVTTTPELPVEPPVPDTPDPDDPALEPGIPLSPATLGSGKYMLTFLAPTGWTTNVNATNEAKWKQPGTSNNTYVMRIEQITSQDLTIADAIDLRVSRLRGEQDEVEVEARGSDSLEYTYQSNEGNARHSFMRWVDVDDDGQADVEIVVHGRERDAPGTSDLVARVTDGMRGASG